MYFLLCFPFYVMCFLAEYNTPFLAMIVPLPIIILITSCTNCWIGTPNIIKQRKKCYNKSCPLNEKSHVEKREDDKPSREQSNEQVHLDRFSTTISFPALTTIRAFFFVFFMYECKFDFIDHLPIESLLMRIMFTTVFRVQFSLIIVATCMLPEKKACSLFSIHSHQNSVTNTPKVPTCSDPVSNFTHIMRFRTNKHKKQKLFFLKELEKYFEKNFKFSKEV